MRLHWCPYISALTIFFLTSGTALYFYIAAKVKSAGDTVGRTITLGSMLALAARYTTLAKDRGWLRWPVSAMWLSAAVFMVLATIEAFGCFNR
jgi:hypothetical protein